MSTAVASASLYEFGDLLYKNNANIQVVQKAKWADSKVVGSPVTSLQPLSRRNSNPVTLSTGNNALNNKLSQSSLLALNDSNSSVLNNNQVSAHRKLDRSHSEPVERNSNALHVSAKSNINTSRYKTELCRPFEESGVCKYGDKCQFAHGSLELRNLVRHPKYKTELCRTFHTIGFCPYGPRCHFIHNAEEARNKASQAVPTPHNIHRPKPLNFGSAYSLGSTADSPSPPSSLSESPTSNGSFFTEEIFQNAPFPASPATPSANTAFSFGQDFSPLVRLNSFGGRVVGPQKPKQQKPQSPVSSPVIVTPQPKTPQASVSAMNRRNLSVPVELDTAPPCEPLILPNLESGSPVGSLSSDLDSLSLAGSPKEPPGSPPKDARSPRLPVFNNLSRNLFGEEA